MCERCVENTKTKFARYKLWPKCSLWTDKVKTRITCSELREDGVIKRMLSQMLVKSDLRACFSWCITSLSSTSLKAFWPLFLRDTSPVGISYCYRCNCWRTLNNKETTNTNLSCAFDVDMYTFFWEAIASFKLVLSLTPFNSVTFFWDCDSWDISIGRV